MAVSSNTYFNNAIVGQMMAGADIDIYETNATPKYAVGTGFVRSDGCKFRYAYAGAATNRGLIVSTDFSETSKADTDNAVIAPASAVAVPDDNIQPGNAGSRYVEITLASITANQLAGGYLHITDDGGEGYTYRIKGNTATDTPATGNIRIELYDKIQTALTATTDVAITGSLYNDVEAATAGTDCIVAGVTCASLTATQPYGWIQTAGPATVLCDRAGSIGNVAALSDDIAGAYQDAAGGGTAVSDVIAEPIIGYIITPGDSSGHGVINLKLE